MLKNSKKKKNNFNSLKKTKKNLGRGPSLYSIKLPPLSKDPKTIIINNPIQSSKSKTILSPLNNYQETETIYQENPLKKKVIDIISETINDNNLKSAPNLIEEISIPNNETKIKPKKKKSVKINSLNNEIKEFEIDPFEKLQKIHKSQINFYLFFANFKENNVSNSFF